MSAFTFSSLSKIASGYFLQIIPKFYTLRAWVQPLTLEEDWALVLPLIDASLICVTINRCVPRIEQAFLTYSVRDASI